MSLEKDGGTISARKAVMGHCPNPDCGLVLVVVPDQGGLWPPFDCPCGTAGDTRSLVNHVRLDVGWRVSDESGPERELRP